MITVAVNVPAVEIVVKPKDSGGAPASDKRVTVGGDTRTTVGGDTRVPE